MKSAMLQDVTIENSGMGIHRETDPAPPSAAVLNGRLRQATARESGYAGSGNGHAPEGPEPVRLWFADTPLGPALAGSVGDALCLLTFPPDETLCEADASPEAFRGYIAKTAKRLGLPLACGDPANDPTAKQLERELAEWFAGARRDFNIPIALRGTPFQRSVWEALRAIPYGTVRSYGDLARSLGKPEAARAAGAANGRNPIAVIVPCHRVIGANGTLTGYAGGLERKRFLLACEKRNATSAEGAQAALFG